MDRSWQRGGGGHGAGVSDEPDGGDEAELVESPDHLDEVVRSALSAPAYALDTEFHRERTYYPHLALVQLAWADRLVLVDPLAIDPRGLAPLLDGPGTAVVHAADQDLEVLEHAVGTIPSSLFDTQVAAGFLGMSTPSLGALCDRFVHIRLPKAERLTDWLARPLNDRQKRYAASDVAHLLEVRALQEAELERRGRLEWVTTECEQHRVRQRGNRDPAEAWRRIKEARQLRGKARSVAIAVAAWRERRAAQVDQPPRFVLADLAVVAIAQRAPANEDELRSVRGLDDRHARGRTGKEILEAVREGLASPRRDEPDTGPELDRELRPAVTLVSAWISQLSRDLEIDAALLATRGDIEALLRQSNGARLAEGWRAQLVGRPIRALVDGEASLAFEGKGRLCLEQRSRRPVDDDAEIGPAHS